MDKVRGRAMKLIAFFGVSLLIMYLYLSFIIMYLPKIKDNHHKIFLFCIYYSTIGMILIYWTFFRSVFSDPGFENPIN